MINLLRLRPDGRLQLRRRLKPQQGRRLRNRAPQERQPPDQALQEQQPLDRALQERQRQQHDRPHYARQPQRQPQGQLHGRLPQLKGHQQLNEQGRPKRPAAGQRINKTRRNLQLKSISGVSSRKPFLGYSSQD